MKYRKHAQELRRLLDDDQLDKRRAGRHYFDESNEQQNGSGMAATAARTARLEEIFHKVREPRISFVGQQGLEAIAVLALHGHVELIRQVTTAFEVVVESDPNDTDPSLLPALVDFLAVLERRPQTFGTIWLFDDKRWPYLYEVRDYGGVNGRRTGYGLEPLRWPTSLAIPKSRQPWLTQPYTQHCMRWPTDAEYAQIMLDHFDSSGMEANAA